LVRQAVPRDSVREWEQIVEIQNADLKWSEYCILMQVCVETNAKSKRRMNSSTGAHLHSSENPSLRSLHQADASVGAKGNELSMKRK
jgi:hypothetical protein